MEYTRMLDMNMVPEWRNKYLDYKILDNALSRAFESKSAKSREKGLDMYFELIKFNQKFSKYFNLECLAQLDKINAFHREKLSEVRGKYNNLQDQLDQVLSSAIYREIQPDLSSCRQNEPGDKTEDTMTVNSVSDLFLVLKRRMKNRDSVISITPKRPVTPSVSPEPASRNKRASCVPRIHIESGEDRDSNNNSININNNLRVDREHHSITRKLSESFAHSAQKLTNAMTPDQLSPIKLNRRLSTLVGIGAPTQHPVHKANIDQDTESALDLQLMHNLTIAEPQSKKKIIASYRKKMEQLKFAFRELYFNLVLFEQYTQLNHTGFEQILRKHDRMFASTLGRKFYQEHVQTADFYSDLQAIDHLIEGVEHVYTLHFEHGNRRKAIEKLQVPTSVYKPTSPLLDFRVGYELGTFAILFIVVILVGCLVETGYDWRTVLRLYRSPLILIIFLFQAGISIIIWKHFKINHVLIFELNPRDNLSYHHFIEFGSILGMAWSISVVLFLFSSQLDIRPSICPLVIIIMIALYLFNPTATCAHRARFWFLRILGRIFTAPFHPVRFADFWIADQLVSIVPLFLDLEFLSCFYTTGEVFSVSHLSHDYASRCVTREPQDLLIRTIVAALPAWFRCAQCLRRWRDENWLTLHLYNAGKYWCMVSVVILSSISQYNKSSFEFDTMRIIWLVAACFTSSLTAYWDIIYDFGLFSKYDDKEDDVNLNQQFKHDPQELSTEPGIKYFIEANQRKRRNWPFLRKELVYPVWVYYFAIIEDIILRFGWMFTISLTEFSGIEAGLVVSLLAPMEMFRRFVWNCIRLENEQLNNCGLFRAVRDFPIEVVAPIDESHLDKVIMMMDSRDGPSMRNRLMKRRTLRPDRASFLVLQPDTPESITRRSSIRA